MHRFNKVPESSSLLQESKNNQDTRDKSTMFDVLSDEDLKILQASTPVISAKYHWQLLTPLPVRPDLRDLVLEPSNKGGQVERWKREIDRDF